MKKLLSILAALGLTATSATAVVACGSSSNDGGNSNSGNQSQQFADQWSGELNFEQNDGEISVDEEGNAHAVLTLHISSALSYDDETNNQIIDNCIKMYKVSSEDYTGVSEDLMNQGSDTYTISFDSRTKDSNESPFDAFKFNLSFYLGKQNDYEIVNKYRIKLFNGSVDQFNNKEFQDFAVLGFNQNSNADIDASDVFKLSLKAWWDNDNDKNEYFKINNLKINKNSDDSVSMTFSFKGKSDSINEFELGKQESWPNSDLYEPLSSDLYTGSIKKDGNIYNASFQFNAANWQDSGINVKTLTDNESFAIITKDKSGSIHEVRTIKIADDNASEIKKENGYLKISKLDKEFSPANMDYKLIFNYGAFVNLNSYSSYGSKLSVSCNGHDLSDWFAIDELDSTSLSFKLYNQKAGWYETGIAWNNFITEVLNYSTGEEAPKIDFSVELASNVAHGEALKSDKLSVVLNKDLFTSSVENKTSKDIVQVGGHYTTGIYLHRSMVVKQSDIVDLASDISISGSNKCVVEDVNTLQKYDNGYALVTVDVYPYGIGKFGTTEVAYLRYMENGYFSPEKEQYSICKLNLGEFWPAGFADSSMTVEGYDESKGIVIDSQKREAKIGTLKYGNNIDTSSIKAKVMSKSWNGQPVEVDGKKTGIDIELKNNVLSIKLNDSFDGRCIRPFNFDAKDDDMVDKYGDYRLQIEISVGLKLSDQGINSKTINLDKIEFTPNKEDVAYIDPKAANNNDFIFDTNIVAAVQKLSAKLAINETGSNVDWGKLSSDDIKVTGVHYGGSSPFADDKEAMKIVKACFSVKYDDTSHELLLNWNGNMDYAGNTYFVKFSYFEFSLNLRTKNGFSVPLNDSNTFRVTFIPKP